MIIEKIIKQGEPKFRNKTTAKTMRGWVNGFISKYAKENNVEMAMVFREVLNALNYYEPESIGQAEIQGWKGKSGIAEIKKFPDKVIITRYQKPARGEEPQKKIFELSNEQIETVLNVIRKLSHGEELDTRYIAMAYSTALNLGHSDWDKGDKPFETDRKQHNLLTNILGFLDAERIIEYKGGKTILL